MARSRTGSGPGKSWPHAIRVPTQPPGPSRVRRRAAIAETGERRGLPEEPYAPLRAEHADLVRALEDLQRFVGSEEERAARWDRLVTALEAHARSEEYSLFPRLRRLPATRDVAREALVDHTRMREISRGIDATPGDDPEYLLLLSELADLVRRHVDLEEYSLMPLALSELGGLAVERIVTACVRQRGKLSLAVAHERVHLGHPKPRGTVAPRSGSVNCRPAPPRSRAAASGSARARSRTR